MPTYAYRCTICTHYFEENVTFKEYASTDNSIKTCPKCKNEMRPSRIIYVPSVIYKGDGFYSTDNRKSEDVHSSESG